MAITSFFKKNTDGMKFEHTIDSGEGNDFAKFQLPLTVCILDTFKVVVACLFVPREEKEKLLKQFCLFA